MRMPEAVAALGDYTADQWGLITTAQAKLAGVEGVTLHRLVQDELLVHLRHGVYGLAASEATRFLPEKVAWLALNPSVPAWQRPILDPNGGVLAFRTAALIHDLGDLAAEQIEIIVPRRRKIRDTTLRLRIRTLPEADVTLIEGLPVTTIERTVVDLLAERVDASHIAPIIHRAVTTNQLDLNRIADRIGPYSRRYGLRSANGHHLLDHLLAHAAEDATVLDDSAVDLQQLQRALATLLTINTEAQETAARTVLTQLNYARREKLGSVHRTVASIPPKSSPNRSGSPPAEDA